MSPERLLAERYDATADIWSIGMTILELWNKQYPFKVRSPIDLSTYLQNFDLRKYLKGTSRSFFNFVDCMLQLDPQDRWPCLELTHHAFFSDLRIENLEDAQRVRF
jgi:serine/threonine protein kinase